MSSVAFTPNPEVTPDRVAPAVQTRADRVKRRLTSPWATIAALVIAVLWTIPTFGLLLSFKQNLTEAAADGARAAAFVPPGIDLNPVNGQDDRIDEALQAVEESVQAFDRSCHDPGDGLTCTAIIVDCDGVSGGTTTGRLGPNVLRNGVERVIATFDRALGIGGGGLRTVPHLSTSCPVRTSVPRAFVQVSQQFPPVAGVNPRLGAPAGGAAPRVTALADLLNQAGIETSVSSQIQKDIWFKLWSNMTVNPISALTGATTDKIMSDDLVLGFISTVMLEAKAIGVRLGIEITDSPEDRHAVTRKLGAFRTSMLQDVTAGRPVELDALVASVLEIGRRVAVPTPNIDALFGLARLQAQVRGLY